MTKHDSSCTAAHLSVNMNIAILLADLSVNMNIAVILLT